MTSEDDASRIVEGEGRDAAGFTPSARMGRKPSGLSSGGAYVSRRVALDPDALPRTIPSRASVLADVPDPTAVAEPQPAPEPAAEPQPVLDSQPVAEPEPPVGPEPWQPAGTEGWPPAEAGDWPPVGAGDWPQVEAGGWPPAGTEDWPPAEGGGWPQVETESWQSAESDAWPRVGGDNWSSAEAEGWPSAEAEVWRAGDGGSAWGQEQEWGPAPVVLPPEPAPGEMRNTSSATVAGSPLTRPGLIIALAVVLVLQVVAFFITPNPEPTATLSGAAIPAQQEGEDASEQPDPDQPASMPESPSAADRIAFAEKSTDANGIVHGVTPDGIAFTIHGAGQQALQHDKVTLSAVGDQLVSEDALRFADANAGDVGDGTYDFTPWYTEVRSFIQSTDLRFVNAETVMVDDGETPFSGYPTFNSPPAAADALAAEQFNLVNFTSNHSYDLGTYGIEKSHEVWDAHPELVIGGSFLTEDSRNTVQLIERNGIRFAFLCYSYGDNTYGDGFEEPNTYYACNFNPDLMAADIERARKVADVVIVGMHWGTEYTTEPNDQQREWAQWLADRDVDLVLGTHAHSIQTVEYYTGASGKRLPVVFGLGNFICGWNLIDTTISGIFSCDFVRQPDGSVMVENPVWHPTIEWSNGGSPYVRFMKDMDPEVANENVMAIDSADPYTYMREKTLSTITQIPVDIGEAKESQGRGWAQGEIAIVYDLPESDDFVYADADDMDAADMDDEINLDADYDAELAYDDDAYYDDDDLDYQDEY